MLEFLLGTSLAEALSLELQWKKYLISSFTIVDKKRKSEAGRN